MDAKFQKYGGQAEYARKLKDSRNELMDLIGRIPDPEEEFTALRQSKKGFFYDSKIKWEELEGTLSKKIYYGRLNVKANEMVSSEDLDKIHPGQIRDALDNPDTIKENLERVRQSPEFKNLMDHYRDYYKTPESFFRSCDFRANADILEHFMKHAKDGLQKEAAGMEKKAGEGPKKGSEKNAEKPKDIPEKTTQKKPEKGRVPGK